MTRLTSHGIAALAALTLTLSATARLAHAGDSTWLVCKGVADYDGGKHYLVVSALEHRSISGDERALDVTLLYGTHASRAQLGTKAGIEFTTKPAALTLKSLTSKNRVVFKGTVQLDDALTKLDLVGTIDPTHGVDAKAKLVPVTAKLTCETLDDLAIGHEGSKVRDF